MGVTGAVPPERQGLPSSTHRLDVRTVYGIHSVVSVMFSDKLEVRSGLMEARAVRSRASRPAAGCGGAEQRHVGASRSAEGAEETARASHVHRGVCCGTLRVEIASCHAAVLTRRQRRRWGRRGQWRQRQRRRERWRQRQR